MNLLKPTPFLYVLFERILKKSKKNKNNIYILDSIYKIY